MSSLEEPVHPGFSSLPALRSLSLSGVDFYDAGLEDVCSLARLESLDLSNTSVTNLTPLLELLIVVGPHLLLRSEERRVGKECLRLCRSRWSPYH